MPCSDGRMCYRLDGLMGVYGEHREKLMNFCIFDDLAKEVHFQEWKKTVTQAN